MPSDVLTSLLGMIASAGQGYEGRKAQAQTLAEAAAERSSKERIANTEAKSRLDVANIGALSDKEIATMKLQSEKENLETQIKADEAKWHAADATDRQRIQAEIDINKSRVDQLDRQLQSDAALKNKELGLKGRELDIDQAYKLGTGRLGTGSRLGGAGSGGDTFQQKLGLEIIKAFAGGGVPRKPEDIVGLARLISQMPEFGGVAPAGAGPQFGPHMSEAPLGIGYDNTAPTVDGTDVPRLFGSATLYDVNQAYQNSPLRSLIDYIFSGQQRGQEFQQRYNADPYLGNPPGQPLFSLPSVPGASATPEQVPAFPNTNWDYVFNANRNRPKKVKTLRP